MKTEADEHLDSAKSNIKNALEELSKIVVVECFGHNGFSADMKEKIYVTFQELMKIKRRFSEE